MGKRSDKPKISKDKYFTPYAPAVPRLLPFLAPQTRFVEPCAGDGRLIRHFQRHGHVCTSAIDIEPNHPAVQKRDALRTRWASPGLFLTNLPWSRPILHRLIPHLSGQAPLWTILDADWMHTEQAAEYLAYCTDIVSIGRVKWMADTDDTGKDNCCWYRFDRKHPGPLAGPTFHAWDNNFTRARRNAAGVSPQGE